LDIGYFRTAVLVVLGSGCLGLHIWIYYVQERVESDISVCFYLNIEPEGSFGKE